MRYIVEIIEKAVEKGRVVLAVAAAQEASVLEAVCDAYEGRRNKAKDLADAQYEDKGCKTYPDFHDLLARKDIDAVWGCVPDHWHGVVYSRAIEAGTNPKRLRPAWRRELAAFGRRRSRHLLYG